MGRKQYDWVVEGGGLGKDRNSTINNRGGDVIGGERERIGEG